MPRTTTPKAHELIATRDVQGDYFFVDLRPKSTKSIHVALGGEEHCGEGYLVRRNTFPFITLEYVTEGLGRISYGDDEPQPLRPGALFTHGPGQRVLIQGVAGSTMVKYFVCISGRGASKVLGQFVPIYGLLPGTGRHAGLGDAFAMLVREGRRHTEFTPLICDHLMQYTLQKIAEASMHPGRHDSTNREKFLTSKALIDDAPLRIKSLQEVCSRIGMEKSGLCRLFKRYQGVSPYQYLLRRKMSLAAEELINNGGLVKEIAERLDYSDPYHFSRVFKSVHGISPAKFIRSYQSAH